MIAWYRKFFNVADATTDTIVKAHLATFGILFVILAAAVVRLLLSRNL